MKLTSVNAFILTAITICMFIVFAVYSGIPARSTDFECINHGDVNLDGEITAEDAQLAFYIGLGAYSPAYEEECAADCNGDGVVTASDAQVIFLVSLGSGECVDPISTPIPLPVVYISSGIYTRGSPEDEPCRLYREGPQHQVTLTRGFYMMTTEVTRQIWADLKSEYQILPSDPSNTDKSPTMDHPVQMVTWHEVLLFANLISLQNEFTPCYYTDDDFTIPIDESNYTSGPFFCHFDADGYRLPTEAEWEFAARAGTSGPFSTHEPDYNDNNCEDCDPDPPLTCLNSIAWWCGTSDTGTGRMAHPVGTKLSNPWELYDMHGNVWEWCWDGYDSYPSENVTDPTGFSSSLYRVVRGGSWGGSPRSCRSANRNNITPDYRIGIIGFRLVRTIP